MELRSQDDPYFLPDGIIALSLSNMPGFANAVPAAGLAAGAAEFDAGGALACCVPCDTG
jgi:hypothetical protein